jgi:hypothetical protein
VSTDGRTAALAGADADALGQVHDEDLAVADLAAAGALDDRGHRPFHEVLLDGDLEPDFLEEVYLHRNAPGKTRGSPSAGRSQASS